MVECQLDNKFLTHLCLVEQGTHKFVGCGMFPVLHVRQIFSNTTFHHHCTTCSSFQCRPKGLGYFESCLLYGLQTNETKTLFKRKSSVYIRRCTLLTIHSSPQTHNKTSQSVNNTILSRILSRNLYFRKKKDFSKVVSNLKERKLNVH